MKLGKIFNIGLVLAVLILYLLQFSSFNKSHSNNETTTSTVVDTARVVQVDTLTLEEDFSNAGLKVAYVNIDSLNLQYQYLKDKEKAFIRESEKEQKKLEKKLESLQKEYIGFVENVQAGLVDQQKAMEMDQVYKKEQMKLMEEEQTIALQLDKKRQATNQEMMANINIFLDSYAKENGYDFIVAYGAAAGVLYANPAYDVTKPVIKGLNAAYRAGLK